LKYSYAYKTSDGVRHEAAIDAPSREAAFENLRAKGIKPIKVVAADGSKANGEVRGVRKRMLAATVLLVALIVGIAAYVGGTRSVASDGAADLALFTNQTRRQVIGDAAVIEKGIRTGWSDVFTAEGDRFLASFAIPGVKAGVRTTSIEALEAALGEEVAKSATHDSSLEARQITAMVEGLKREARAYIAAGGSVVEYGKRLTERQDAEIAIYKRAEAEVLAARKSLGEDAFTDLLERRNDELRNLGIGPITLSE